MIPSAPGKPWGQSASRAGRFTIPRFLGIDVGGTKVALAVGDERGTVLARRRRPTEPSGDPRADLARIVDDAHALLDEAGLAATDLATVGVSLPGPLDPELGVILSPPNLPGWDRLQVREPLARAFDRPVILENDANAAALAEWRFGAGRGFEHLVYLTMSTGVGGGLILGGRLHRGVRCSAGEVGHVPIEWQGEPCSCGMRGCLEAYVGGAAWERHLRRVTPADGEVARRAGRIDRVRPEHLVESARAGDSFALAEMDRWVELVARGVVQIVFTLAPQAIVLGTIAVAAGEELCFRPLRERVARFTWPHMSRDLQLRPAALGDRLPYLAGLAVALEEDPAGGS